MVYAHCNECNNDKYYLDAYNDDAICTECGNKFPASNSIHNQEDCIVEDFLTSEKPLNCS